MTRRKRMMEDLDQDIREHIALETQDNIERGMSPEDARYAAVRKFGNVMRVKEETREVWSFVWLEQLWQDIRYALRMLSKSPGFAAIAILTLALGIGANTSLFSVVNGVLLNPLPYPNSNQVVTAANWFPGFGEGSISYPDFLDWARLNHTFSSLAAYRQSSFNLTGQGDAERVSAMEISASFFPLLSVNPIIGRDFSSAEDQLGGPPAVILSGGFWKTKFGSSPDIIGKALNLDGRKPTQVQFAPRCGNSAKRSLLFQASAPFP